MRLILVAILALSLKPSLSLSSEPLRENILLAYCEKVLLDNVDYIFVEASRAYPSLAQVKVLYTDKTVESIHVGLNEWHEKSITLPSGQGITYRLYFKNNAWQILRSLTNRESIHPINCSARI